MTIQVKKNKGITQLVVQEEMTIYTALEQKNVFMKHLNADKEIQVNLAAVTEIDSAGLQILLFLKQETQQRQIKLSLTDHSQAVVEVFELLNLTTHFGDPVIISAQWKA